MFNGVTIKLDKDNTDGDGRLDYQEYVEGTTPYAYDKEWHDYVWEFVQGFFAGDIIHETDSVAIVMGQIVGSFVPYVDIRDVAANLVYGDYGFALLSFIGLATGGGDAAKAGVTVIKFVIKNADNLPMMMNLFEGLLKNFSDLVADLSKNDMFTEMVEGLAKADTSKLTRSEAEVYEQFLRNVGVSEDIIKGGLISSEIDMDKVYIHVFSQDHIKNGIMELGKTEKEIVDNFFDIAKSTSSQWVEGSNEIRTLINGKEVTIRIFIKEGKIYNLDGFVGYSQRVIGNLILY